MGAGSDGGKGSGKWLLVVTIECSRSKESSGPDVQLYASAVDASSDVNNLNSNGIVTVFNAFGTGFRVWGNRSSAYPSSTRAGQFHHRCDARWT